MRIDQVAVLLAIVVLANVALLAAVGLPRLAAVRARRRAVAEGGVAAPVTGGARPALEPAADETAEGVYVPPALYERMVRVVSFLFIGSALVVVTLTGIGDQSLTYLLLASAAFLVVIAQDVVPLSVLGRWRYPIEALAATIFVTLLIMVTGGADSPFFFGYLLLLAGASLWAEGIVPFVLALLASAAYLLAVALAPDPPPFDINQLGEIVFNLVALALISYVAAVIGREQRRAREAALRLSRYDLLSGLHNRGFFDAAIEREILRAARNNRPFSLLMLDLDGLKAVNDRWGHESGDLLLRAVAEVIRNGIRASDFAARYGGDEFVVVLPETDMHGALNVGEKLRYDISRLALRHNGDVLQTSASIGLVAYPEDGRTSGELMRRVDLAMYEAKRRGRNQLVRYARPHERPARPADAIAPADIEEPGEGPPGPHLRPMSIPIEPRAEPGQRTNPPSAWEQRER